MKDLKPSTEPTMKIILKRQIDETINFAVYMAKEYKNEVNYERSRKNSKY